MRQKIKKAGLGLGCWYALCLSGLAPVPVMAQTAQTSASQKVIRLVANDQDILRLSQVPQRVAISDESVADVQILSASAGQRGEDVLNGQRAGTADWRGGAPVRSKPARWTTERSSQV